MECNKDEAIRAKEIAEGKFTAKDFSGARKFALKAQSLYPSLEGISNMLATIEIHISSENKVCGEMDLYGMLGVDPLADDDVIKKKYKQLLLLIHPDKNKSIGASNAFQLLLNAFRVLSDEVERSLYNTRLHIRMPKKVPSQAGVSGATKSVNPAASRRTKANVDNPAASSSSRGKAPRTGPQKAPQKAQTSWSPVFGTNNYNSSIHTSATHGSRKRKNEATQAAGQRNTGFVLREAATSKRMKETSNNDVTNGFTAYGARVNATRELSTPERTRIIAEKGLGDVKVEVRKTKWGRKGKENVKQTSKLVVEKVSAPEFKVPDPDFHIFDSDRSERCFGENQVWAAYDDVDGMPRYYALIQEVVSTDPFNLKISWLNSRSSAEFGELDWIGRGFIKSSGDFWVGKHETSNLLNSFSHKVKFDKGPRGVFQIYPKEGDIWAVYRNWSPEWDILTANSVTQAYDMVQVLDDYTSEKGVHVAPIIKTPGFRTVFQLQPDQKAVKHIPKEEMFRFSHQVPHHILTGHEKPNAPMGFIDLDPASTPAELLQVIPDTDQEQVTGCGSTSGTKPCQHQ